ncbi:hypothetical protein L195_g041479, partial [Trifolium pratense]
MQKQSYVILMLQLKLLRMRQGYTGNTLESVEVDADLDE